MVLLFHYVAQIHDTIKNYDYRRLLFQHYFAYILPCFIPAAVVENIIFAKNLNEIRNLELSCLQLDSYSISLSTSGSARVFGTARFLIGESLVAMSYTLAFMSIPFTEATASILDEKISYPVRHFRSLIAPREIKDAAKEEIRMEKKR